MHRIYEWARFILKEKVNTFIKGASSGMFLSGIFLFGSNFSGRTAIIVEGLIKLFIVVVTGFLSGFITVIGKSAAERFQKAWKEFWNKPKLIKRRPRKKKAA